MDRLAQAAAAYESLLRVMVDEPERLLMKVVDQGGGKVTFQIKVDRADIGKLIGMQGRTARSLRIILGSIGIQVERKITLDIVCDE